MIRLQIIEITSCLQCNKLITTNGFSSHQLTCLYNGLSSIEIGNPGSSKLAENELKSWFENCTVWELKK